MIREIVTIDEDVCNGCGECIPNCHEGALQMIDGKARLVSDLLCDGLGACIGHCPVGAIFIEEREAEPYNESKVMALMVEKGKNTVIAHLKHLKDHNEFKFLQEGVNYLHEHATSLLFDVQEVVQIVHNHGKQPPSHNQHSFSAQNSAATNLGTGKMSFEPKGFSVDTSQVTGKSQLRQWPVQLHLVNPEAQYFRSADVLLAADCVAFSVGNFHDVHLKGKSLAIACPKLDHGSDIYIEKLTTMIDNAHINTLTVMVMEVACCRGLLKIAQAAIQQAQRNMPVKLIKVSVVGEIIEETWM